jgi:hypothetical protein
MTLRGPRVGINFIPGCLIWMVAIAVAVTTGLLW